MNNNGKDISNNKKLLNEVSGNSRERMHLLAESESKVIDFLYPLVPPFIQTYHLTLSTILSSLALIIFGLLARENIWWLLGVAFAIEFHFITDMLDGEVGRRRKTGLILWGFYADHFLDLFFAGCLFITFSIVFPQLVYINFGLFIIMALFFFDTSLYALVGNKYLTSGFLGRIGPTELTHALVILTILFIFIPFYWIKILFYFFFGFCFYCFLDSVF